MEVEKKRMQISDQMKKIAVKTTSLSCLFFLIFSLSFSLLPQTGNAFTIGEERKVGEKLLYMVRQQFKVIDDPDIIQYLNRLGHEILAAAGPQYYDYHFFLIQDKEFNAFAAPSGLIFFYTGLVETMQSEDELVSVMAHEVGHVTSRHLASRLEKNQKIGIGTMALALASLAVGNPALSQGLLAGTLAAGQTLSLRFSRMDEEQSDRLSFTWMQAMRRNPVAMETMLQTMRRITRYRMGGEIPPYLLTHPEPEARLFYVQSLLDFDNKQKKPDFYKKTDEFEFLRMKYKMMVEIKKTPELRNYLAGIVSSPDKGDLEKNMAQYGMALLHAKEFQFDKAIKVLGELRKQMPDRNILLVDTGAMYLELGNVDHAVQLLQQARKNDPADMYATAQLARAFQKKGQLNEAKQLYMTVSEAMPEYSKAYYEIARIQSAQGHTGAGYYSLAQYNLYEGKIKPAKQFLRRAIKEKTSPPLTVEKAEALLEKIEELEKE